MPSYSRQNLQDAIWDPLVEDSISSILTVQNIMNESVREVIGELDLRSTKRNLSTPINLFDDDFDYFCPTDMKGIKIVDIVPQLPRSHQMQWNLVSVEEFDRRKYFEKLLIAFKDQSFLRKTRISAPKGTVFYDITIDSLDTILSGLGSYAVEGDATNLRQDNLNFVEGAGCLMFDIGAGGTGMAGIKNTQLSVFDLTNYITQGSIFIWVYIPNTTGITNFELQIGVNMTNYYGKTVTTDLASNAFVTGWNLLKFDLGTSTTVGSPVATNCQYVDIRVNSSPAITASSNWRFDMVKAQVGRYYDMVYYSKFGWQTAGGTWIENSTLSTDLLNVDTDEFDLIKLKAQWKAAKWQRDWDMYKAMTAEYQTKSKLYTMNYPSEALLLTQTHYDFAKDVDIEGRNERIEGFNL